jgi:hypothetical protein
MVTGISTAVLSSQFSVLSSQFSVLSSQFSDKGSWGRIGSARSFSKDANFNSTLTCHFTDKRVSRLQGSMLCFLTAQRVRLPRDSYVVTSRTGVCAPHRTSFEFQSFEFRVLLSTSGMASAQRSRCHLAHRSVRATQDPPSQRMRWGHANKFRGRGRPRHTVVATQFSYYAMQAPPVERRRIGVVGVSWDRALASDGQGSLARPMGT